MSAAGLQGTVDAVRRLYQNDKLKRILIGAAGGGALLAGAGGMSRLFADQRDRESEPYSQSRRLRLRKFSADGDFAGGYLNAYDMAYPAALTAAAVGGVSAGYAGIQSLLGKLRAAQKDRELAEARREYEAALSGSKVSGARGELCNNINRIIAALDAADDNTDKLSLLKKRELSTAAGVIATLLGGIALTSGYHGYQDAKRNSWEKALRSAQLERVNTQRPYTPTPVLVDVKKDEE